MCCVQCVVFSVQVYSGAIQKKGCCINSDRKISTQNITLSEQSVKGSAADTAEQHG